MFIKNYLLVMCLGLLPFFSLAQFTISGDVRDKNSGEYLPGATIVSEDGALSTTTDSDGSFRIKNVNAGTYQMSISFIGYKTLIENVEVNSNVNVDFELIYTPVLSDEVIVQSTRAQKKFVTV